MVNLSDEATMKKNEIKVGGHYLAKVSDKITTVRVDAVRSSNNDNIVDRYEVTNIATGRKTTFRSAAKFRSEVIHLKESVKRSVKEVEQRSDPTPVPTSPPASSVTGAVAPPAVKSPSSSVLSGRLTTSTDNSPHVIVEARAGTGKTTTLITALKILQGQDPGITPSPQQQAVWDAVALSKGKVKTIGFVAFNKSIATELQQRVPTGVEAMTLHSLGFKAVRAAYPRVKVSEFRTQDLLASIMGVDGRELKRAQPILVNAIVNLVGLCKMNLIGQDFSDEEGLENEWAIRLRELASYYGTDLGGGESGPDISSQVFQMVPKILQASQDPLKDGQVDYDDMIWLPVVLNLSIIKFDLLMVDEAQDLNRCQQSLAKTSGRRLILCGDPKQAIYGFAGADSESMKRMEEELSELPLGITGVRLFDGQRDLIQKEIPGFRGCKVLPLTVTRRCGKAIVKEANKYVPSFEAFETNPEGEVKQGLWEPDAQRGNQTYRDLAVGGNMVLCRTNAPLVKECFRFIKAGRKANIQGRDVGKGLSSLVSRLCGQRNGVTAVLSITELVAKLDDWLNKELGKENAKRNPSENRLDAIQDRYDCLMAFTEGATYSSEVLNKIEQVFTDDKKSAGIRLSSIHKAKGLEADQVFFLKPIGGPRRDKMKAWELEQENNLEYVAITRAISTLVYVRQEKK